MNIQFIQPSIESTAFFFPPPFASQACVWLPVSTVSSIEYREYRVPAVVGVFRFFSLYSSASNLENNPTQNPPYTYPFSGGRCCPLKHLSLCENLHTVSPFPSLSSSFPFQLLNISLSFSPPPPPSKALKSIIFFWGGGGRDTWFHGTRGACVCVCVEA